MRGQIVGWSEIIIEQQIHNWINQGIHTHKDRDEIGNKPREIVTNGSASIIRILLRHDQLMIAQMAHHFQMRTRQLVKKCINHKWKRKQEEWTDDKEENPHRFQLHSTEGGGTRQNRFQRIDRLCWISHWTVDEHKIFSTTTTISHHHIQQFNFISSSSYLFSCNWVTWLTSSASSSPS